MEPLKKGPPQMETPNEEPKMGAPNGDSQMEPLKKETPKMGTPKRGTQNGEPQKGNSKWNS